MVSDDEQGELAYARRCRRAVKTSGPRSCRAKGGLQGVNFPRSTISFMGLLA